MTHESSLSHRRGKRISLKLIKAGRQEKRVFEPFWDKGTAKARMQYYEDRKGKRTFIVEPKNEEEIKH